MRNYADQERQERAMSLAVDAAILIIAVVIFVAWSLLGG